MGGRGMRRAILVTLSFSFLCQHSLPHSLPPIPCSLLRLLDLDTGGALGGGTSRRRRCSTRMFQVDARRFCMYSAGAGLRLGSALARRSRWGADPRLAAIKGTTATSRPAR